MSTLMICGKDDPIFKQLSRDWYVFAVPQNPSTDLSVLQIQIDNQAAKNKHNSYWGSHTVFSRYSDFDHDYLVIYKDLSNELSYEIWNDFTTDFFNHIRTIKYPIGYVLTEEHYYLMLTNCLLGLPYLLGIELEEF